MRSLRPRELVRTSLRNQTIRHNISFVRSRTDGRGNLSLIYQTEDLQSVIDNRNTRNEKNTKTQRDRNMDSDMDETGTDETTSNVT